MRFIVGLLHKNALPLDGAKNLATECMHRGYKPMGMTNSVNYVQDKGVSSH